MNFTALGGSVWALGETPMLARTSLRDFRYLRNVVGLTPASRANSDLYIVFIFCFLFCPTEITENTEILSVSSVPSVFVLVIVSIDSG